eukprot:g17530.t1
MSMPSEDQENRPPIPVARFDARKLRERFRSVEKIDGENEPLHKPKLFIPGKYELRGILSERKILSRVGSLLKRHKSRDEWSITPCGLDSDAKKFVFSMVPPDKLRPDSPLSVNPPRTKGLPEPAPPQEEPHRHISLLGAVLYLPSLGEQLAGQDFCFELISRARRSASIPTAGAGRSYLLACSSAEEREEWVTDILRTGVVQLRSSRKHFTGQAILTSSPRSSPFSSYSDWSGKEPQFGRHGLVKVQVSFTGSNAPGQDIQPAQPERTYWLRFYVHRQELSDDMNPTRANLEQRLRIKRNAYTDRIDRAMLQCFPWPDIMAGSLNGEPFPDLEQVLDRGATALEQVSSTSSQDDETQPNELVLVFVNPQKDQSVITRWRLAFLDNKSLAGWKKTLLRWLRGGVSTLQEIERVEQKAAVPDPASVVPPYRRSVSDVSHANLGWLHERGSMSADQKLRAASGTSLVEDKENDKENSLPDLASLTLGGRSVSERGRSLTGYGSEPGTDKENSTPSRSRHKGRIFSSPSESAFPADYDLSESESENDDETFQYSERLLDPSRKLLWSPPKVQDTDECNQRSPSKIGHSTTALATLIEDESADAKGEGGRIASATTSRWGLVHSESVARKVSFGEQSVANPNDGSEFGLPLFSPQPVSFAKIKSPVGVSEILLSPEPSSFQLSLQPSISAKFKSPTPTTITEKLMSPEALDLPPCSYSPNQTPLKGDEQFPMPEWSPASSPVNEAQEYEICVKSPAEVLQTFDKGATTPNPFPPSEQALHLRSVSKPNIVNASDVVNTLNPADIVKASASAARKFYEMISPGTRKIASPGYNESNGSKSQEDQGESLETPRRARPHDYPAEPPAKAPSKPRDSYPRYDLVLDAQEDDGSIPRVNLSNQFDDAWESP